MVYFTGIEADLVFPKVNIMPLTAISFENQITKEIFTVNVMDLTNKKDYYTVNLQPFTDLFSVGQYDYTLYNNDTPVGTGILQYGDFINNVENYSPEYNLKQYEPNT